MNRALEEYERLYRKIAEAQQDRLTNHEVRKRKMHSHQLITQGGSIFFPTKKYERELRIQANKLTPVTITKLNKKARLAWDRWR